MGQESEHSFPGSSALESLQGWVREWGRAEVSFECSAEEGFTLKLSELLAGLMSRGWAAGLRASALVGGWLEASLHSLLMSVFNCAACFTKACKPRRQQSWLIRWKTRPSGAESQTSYHFGDVLQLEISLWASPHSVEGCDNQETGVFSSGRL